MLVDAVTAYQQALSDRNFEAARELLRDDLQFAGPFESFESADDYLQAVRGLWNIVEAIDIKHVSTAGDEVVVLPTGNPHWVKDSPSSSAPSLTSILAHHDVIDGELRFGGDDGPLTEIVCGVFMLEGARSTPWIERLPQVVVSRADLGPSD